MGWGSAQKSKIQPVKLKEISEWLQDKYSMLAKFALILRSNCGNVNWMRIKTGVHMGNPPNGLQVSYTMVLLYYHHSENCQIGSLV